MKRTQIQFPDPLYERLKKIAEERDWSLAEVVRRAAEAYLQTLPEGFSRNESVWEMPVLSPSGGYHADPASVRAEVDAILSRGTE